MTYDVADTSQQQHPLDEPLGVITAAEFEEARRDPEVIAVHEEADRLLTELKRQGRSL